MCLLNKSGAVTFRSVAETSMDLIVASVSLAHRMQWHVEEENLCGSDHLPIFIQYQHSDILNAFEPLNFEVDVVKSAINIPAKYNAVTMNKRFAKNSLSRGGVTLLIDTTSVNEYCTIPLKTPLEAVAVKATFPQMCTPLTVFFTLPAMLLFTARAATIQSDRAEVTPTHRGTSTPIYCLF